MVPVVERYAVRDKVEATVAVYEGYKQTSCPADVDSTGSPKVVGRAIVRVSVRAADVSVVIAVTVLVAVGKGTNDKRLSLRNLVATESVAITVSLPQLSVVVGPGI
jgi:hypothetical protein